jgi:hypothetical protein
MKARATVATALSVALAAITVGAAIEACAEPPPKIASIPPSGISLRVFVFGASAQNGYQAFEAAKQTNKNLRIVHEGGDGEVLVNLENDSPKCVPPTALCSYKLAFRIRDNQGKVVHATTTTADANAEHCSGLCEKALNSMVVKVIDAATESLKIADADASVDPQAGAAEGTDASASVAASSKPASKKATSKPASSSKPDSSGKPEPAICGVAHGPHLAAEEAEKRAAQVEALKRLGVLDQEEYDCLRKAYLDRL